MTKIGWSISRHRGQGIEGGGGGQRGVVKISSYLSDTDRVAGEWGVCDLVVLREGCRVGKIVRIRKSLSLLRTLWFSNGLVKEKVIFLVLLKFSKIFTLHKRHAI